jgi:predicted Zn-dependent peptidase
LAQGLLAIDEELTKFSAKGISAKEHEMFRRQIEGSHKVAISTAVGLSRAILSNAEQGRPLKFIDQFVPMLTSIGRREVNTAISRHINPDKVVRVAAGVV